MANLYNAGQLATIITQLGEQDIPDLGSTPNTYIYYYMNIVLMKYAKLANVVTYSDALAISANGQHTFQISSVNITDMYEPLVVLNSSDSELQKRSSYSAPIGWWRDSQNQQIHFRGVTGNYTLKYLKYPARITLDTDTIEFPPSGYDLLIKEVLSLIKYSKNSYAGADFMDAKAKVSIGEAEQGTESAMGTGSSGSTPSPANTLIARGG